MSPYPGAYTDIPLSDGSTMELKILRAFPEPEPGVIFPTVFQTDRRTFLRMGLKDGSLLLTEVQPAGKKVMKIGEFLNGYGRLIS
jgi:methionyl-tRNA formyltransferase